MRPYAVHQDGRTASARSTCGPDCAGGLHRLDSIERRASHGWPLRRHSKMQILQFNVPASQANGTINNPLPQDQYAIIAGSVDFADDGWEVGQDWAVFDVSPNPNTGRLPVHAQGAFFRTSRDTIPSGVHITGYGLDGPAPNFRAPPPRNADNQTQQTHTGPQAGTGRYWQRLRCPLGIQGGHSGELRQPHYRSRYGCDAWHPYQRRVLTEGVART